MDRDLTNKLARLQELLQAYGKVAVAFSGGVDSTLLLRVACDTLGPEKVTALHAVSCVIPEQDQIKTAKLATAVNGIPCPYLAVKVYPLRCRDFVANSEQRCYFCKKRTYGALQTAMSQDGTPSILLDGTNTDDLLEYRPGLRAVQELSVGTPLAQARFNKKDIRALSRKLGLPNFNQPSNSCLATRIQVHQKITSSLLKRIAQAEQFLQKKGFMGCRVRVGPDTVVVQVISSDLDKIIGEHFRSELSEYLETLGFNNAVLDTKGRDTF
ncbi:MAG: ATP-dependent sacrificial sulfur transferase LarE [Desulfoarculaceae bacterium]|nr:ATP-dependent sacrificial sulfur transferase LarE [Desulfoarculaceae bacterium]